MAEAGLRLLAITDHDTLAGYRELRARQRPRVEPAARARSRRSRSTASSTGLIETASARGGELHILGYGVDPDDAAFEAPLADQRSSAASRLDLIVDAAARAGSADRRPRSSARRSSDDRALGRPHVARALVARRPRRVGQRRVRRRILIGGGPAYVPRQGSGPRAAIDAIRAAGGLAGARPLRRRHRSRPTCSATSRRTGACAASRSTTAASTPRRSRRSRRSRGPLALLATGG